MAAIRRGGAVEHYVEYYTDVLVNAVEFDCVSKSYCIYKAPGDRLRELAFFGQRSLHREFQALRELSFSVRRGEVFCIIGENGSGKSTSLQLIAGILQPTSGEVRISGRVAALLELGAGFNPEFSGRENVYLNAAILGLTKREIDRRYPLIQEFAEIGAFIDQPVKTYSSGMAMRLAFAVAINVDPEILLVDEALAVGDTYFRHRCMRKVQELRARGLTIIFVSHSMADVKAIGDRVLWLRRGESVAIGAVDAVVQKYLSAMTNPVHESNPEPVAISESIPNIDRRHGSGAAEILGVAVLNEFGETLHLMTPNSTITVRITLCAVRSLAAPGVGFMLRNHLGLDFAETSTTVTSLKAGEKITVDFRLEIPELYPGSFSFSPWVADPNKDAGETCDFIDNAVTVQMARGEGPVYGYVQWPCRIELNSLLHSQLHDPEEARVG
jgi:ABC-type polysaccharide/polyol phosphate transport system ATPase subunit